jgi:hypothetical protein
MDHAYIEEHGLVERYYRSDLSADQEVPFEEHFMGCSVCQERLALARSLRQGIRALATEDTVRRAVVGAGLLAWLARRGPALRMGLLVAVFLVALLPSTWLLLENRRLTHEVGDVGSPQVLLLSAYRDAPGESAAVLDLDTMGPSVVLAVDVGDDPRFESFQVTIEDQAGAGVLHHEGMRPNALEVLMLSVPADFFPAGDYRLRVEGLTGDGKAFELGGYPFRVVADVP